MAQQRALSFDPIEAATDQWRTHGWGDAAPGMAAVTSVMRAQQIYLASVESVLRELDLTFARYELLMLLSFSRSGAMPLSRVGARLQVHPTSVTNVVDRLEEQQLIERLPHATDRRTTLAAILPGGRKVAEMATARLNAEVFELPGLSPSDLAELFAILRRLRLASGDFEPAEREATGAPTRVRRPVVGPRPRVGQGHR